MILKILASRGNGLVAIWWYTDDGEFWEVSRPVDDGYLDGDYIQYSERVGDNHLSLWKQICNEHDKAQYSKGYKSLERGRVIYNTKTQCFEVICSSALVNDSAFRQKCIDYFNLSGNRVEFVKLDHYYRFELTGNPAVDNLEY